MVIFTSCPAKGGQKHLDNLTVYTIPERFLKAPEELYFGGKISEKRNPVSEIDGIKNTDIEDIEQRNGNETNSQA